MFEFPAKLGRAGGPARYKPGGNVGRENGPAHGAQYTVPPEQASAAGHTAKSSMALLPASRTRCRRARDRFRSQDISKRDLSRLIVFGIFKVPDSPCSLQFDEWPSRAPTGYSLEQAWVRFHDVPYQDGNGAPKHASPRVFILLVDGDGRLSNPTGCCWAHYKIRHVSWV